MHRSSISSLLAKVRKRGGKMSMSLKFKRGLSRREKKS